MTKPEGNFKVTKITRGRAATYDHSPVEISEPHFVFTDAEARDDLYALPRRRASPNDETESPKTGGPGRPGASPFSTEASPRENTPKKAPIPLLDAAAALRFQHQSKLGIGMAIGSPSHSPWKHDGTPPPKHAMHITSPLPTAFSSVPYSPITTPEPQEDQQRQKGKWKVLGGLFTKKANSGQESSQKAHPEPQQRRKGSESGEIPRPSKELLPFPMVYTGYSNQHTQATASSKPLTRVPETGPQTPPKDEPRPSPRRAARSDPIPMLQVDIPDIKMERYSVMFNNVLNPRQSTLLMRRQAQLQPLKVNGTPQTASRPPAFMFFANEKQIEEKPEDEHSDLAPPVRRATLPSPAKSPAYTLFPNTKRGVSPRPGGDTAHPPDTDVKADRGIPTLKRSMTAPSLSPRQTASTKPSESAKATTPQVIVEDVDSSPIPESPETPREPNWASKLLPDAPRSSSLSEPDENQRITSGSIIIHIADDIAIPEWKPVPEPRPGTIEVGGEPVYHTPVVAPIPKRPSELSPPAVLQKPLPVLMLEPKDERVNARQLFPTEVESNAQLAQSPEELSPLVLPIQVPADQWPAAESPRPPPKDDPQPKSAQHGRSISCESWQSQPFHQRTNSNQQPSLLAQRRPSNPPRDLTVPTNGPRPQPSLTEFHVRSPRKGSLPITPSLPMDVRPPRKASLAAVAQSPIQVLPPKSFPLLHPPKPLGSHVEGGPATPPKNNPPVPAKDPHAKDLSKDGSAAQSKQPSAAAQPSSNGGPVPQRERQPSPPRKPVAAAALSAPVSVVPERTSPEKPAIVVATAVRRPSVVTVERQMSAPVVVQRPNPADAERRPSASAAEQPSTERRPSVAAAERPGLPRAVTDHPHPLRSAPPSRAEISIARQISISRRQQQMMVPIVPKTVRQPQQAMLVVREEPGAQTEPRRARHAPQKSQHALVETA